jgi:hypothetical protein
MTSNTESEGLAKNDYAVSVSRSDAKCGYRDFSMEAEEGIALDESFPIKLHYMLADVQRDGNDYIVSWHGHGR